jgi:hypothetical protein
MYPKHDSMMVGLDAMVEAMDMPDSDQAAYMHAAQVWLDIKRVALKAATSDDESAQILVPLDICLITADTPLLTMAGVMALCTRSLDSLPDPVLTERTQALVSRTNTAANQAITEASKHGAPAHWNGQAAMNTYRDCKALWSARRNESIPRQIVQAIATLLAEAVPVIHARMVATEGQQEANELVKGLLGQISTLANHHLYPLVDAADQIEYGDDAEQSAAQTALDANEIAHRALEMFCIVFTLVGTVSRAFAPGANHMVAFQMKGL